jgi:hypothetical protein
MRNMALLLAAVAFVSMAPQPSSAAALSGGLEFKPTTSHVTGVTFYRRDYDYYSYYPRYRYSDYHYYYPRYRYYYYDDDIYYPRLHYYPYEHYPHYRTYYYRRYRY